MDNWQPIRLRIGTNVRMSCQITEGRTRIEDGHPVVEYKGKPLDWLTYGEAWTTRDSRAAPCEMDPEQGHMKGAAGAIAAARGRGMAEVITAEIDAMEKRRAEEATKPSTAQRLHAAEVVIDRISESATSAAGGDYIESARATIEAAEAIKRMPDVGEVGMNVPAAKSGTLLTDVVAGEWDAVARTRQVRQQLNMPVDQAANDEDEHAGRMAFNVPYETYALSPSVNWSTLKVLGDSPLHYQHAKGHSKPSTPSMKVGTVTHIAVLEPHRWEPDVAVWDGGRRGTNAHKAWAKEHEGQFQINDVEAKTALAMGAAVRANHEAMALLAEGHAEVVVEWFDLMAGMWCKARIDWLIIKDDRAIIADFKTTRSLDRRAFSSQVASMGYHSQLAHYAAGVAAVTGLPVDVFIIAVESSAPHDVGVFELDEGMPDGALYVGESVRRVLLAQLAECIRLDHWPGRYERVEPLNLPVWALIGDDAEEFTFEGEG